MDRRPWNVTLTPGRLLAAAIVALGLWILHGFVEAVVAASVTAVASWPLYTRFRSRLPSRVGRRLGAILFTSAIAAFVLAPMAFAAWALLDQLHLLLRGLAQAGGTGIAMPSWLPELPAIGAWLATRWQGHLGQPDSLALMSRHADPTTLLGWLQSLGRFTFHHALVVAFTALLLCSLYEQGPALAGAVTGMLHRAVGQRAERYVDVATRAVRASVYSMFAVALFDGCASALAYASAGVPRALLWGAITGALAAVPFVGYAAVAAMAVQLVVLGAATPALLSLLLGCAVLLAGDKVVRPLVAGGGIRLPFVWIMMGCIGGFGTLGLTGLVIGPVVLALGRELCRQQEGDFGG